MLTFEKFLARHSEAAAQALIEAIEKREGLAPDMTQPLEQRWQRVMAETPVYSQAA